eukprot:gene3634-4568_t
MVQHKKQQKEQTANEQYAGGGSEQQDMENSSNSMEVGVFRNEGRLNMMHVDAVNEHFEKGTMSSRRQEDTIEKLLRYDDGLTRKIQQRLSEKGYAQIPICDGVHWRLLLFTETRGLELTTYVYDSFGEGDEQTEKLREALREWTNRHIDSQGRTAMEEGTPGELVITGETQQGTGRTRQEETNVMERPAKEQKQMGLHNIFLHKLREEKGKRAETEMANTSQRESGENGNERGRVQTDLRMYMSPMADMKRKPRTDGGPNEPAPDEELKETAGPGTTKGEEGGERKEGGSSTKHPNEKLQMQMPVTEKWNAATVLTEPRKCRLNALTWNIQGNEEALYDLEPALEEWDIDLAILTEVKSGNTLYYGSTLCYGVILRYGSDVFVFVRFALI